MKPAVVLNQKDVKRLMRLAEALTKLADEIENGGATKARVPRAPRAVPAKPAEAS